MSLQSVDGFKHAGKRAMENTQKSKRTVSKVRGISKQGSKGNHCEENLVQEGSISALSGGSCTKKTNSCTVGLILYSQNQFLDCEENSRVSVRESVRETTRSKQSGNPGPRPAWASPDSQLSSEAIHGQ